MLVRSSVLYILLCVGVGYAQSPPQTDPAATDPAATGLGSAPIGQLRADVEYLSSEQLRGRGVDDEASIAKAAQYIATRMDQIGLDTSLYDGTPFQKVPLTLDARAGAAERNRLVITVAGAEEKKITASLADGMNPLAIGSLSGRVKGRLVFAGYGITAPRLNYDDYEDIDAAGAVVVILRKEPGASDPESPFNGTRNTPHAYFANKVDNAIKHGASAIVFVNDLASVQRSVADVQQRIDQEQKVREQTLAQRGELPEQAVNIRKTLAEKLTTIDSMIQSLQSDRTGAAQGLIGVAAAGQRPEGKDSIPVISVSRELVDQILQRTVSRSLPEFEAQINRDYSPLSVELPAVTVVMQVELKPAIANTSNVIGVLEGRGALAEESLVIGAHYDHVGMGGEGSLAPGTVEIHNGADDNASGTAALLVAAQQLAARLPAVASHRRIIFIAFTGEERGLIGSKYYVRAPRFPLESTVAMINMDMVGRLRDNELTIYGTGSAPMMDEILEQANQRQQFKLFPVATGYGPSDHQSFYEAGIPVMFFFTGLHNDYHRPTDDFDKINFGGLTRITDTVSDVAYQLAIRADRPRYTETEGLPKIRRQLTAYLGVTVSERGGRVVLTALAPGGPAERDGLKSGDTIVKLGGYRMRTSADVLDQLREHAPEDELRVRVNRQGKTLDLTVRLGDRPGR